MRDRNEITDVVNVAFELKQNHLQQLCRMALRIISDVSRQQHLTCQTSPVPTDELVKVTVATCWIMVCKVERLS